MIPILATIWGRVITGVAGAMLVLAVLFWGLWRMADGARAEEREARLAAEDRQLAAEIETKRTLDALNAAEARADARAAQTATQRQDEETVRDAPETYDCASSPAIHRSLRVLLGREDRAATDDNPSEPSNLFGLSADAEPGGGERR